MRISSYRWGPRNSRQIWRTVGKKRCETLQSKITKLAIEEEFGNNLFGIPLRTTNSDPSISNVGDINVLDDTKKFNSDTAIDNIIHCDSSNVKIVVERKRVRIDPCVRVILIAAREELIRVGLDKILWYQKQEYDDFKKAAIDELLSKKVKTSTSTTEGSDTCGSEGEELEELNDQIPMDSSERDYLRNFAENTAQFAERRQRLVISRAQERRRTERNDAVNPLALLVG